MMLPTHALMGMVLGLLVGAAAPEFAGVALLAGLVGGVLPDLDMYAGHRKRLHYPVYYAALAGPALVLAGLVPTAATVGVAVFLLGATVHSATDVFGGGLELRPWEATSNRAVYDHYRGTWIEPRRWVRYDGAPEDLLVAVVLAVPLVVSVDGALQAVAYGSLGVGAVYVVFRRTLADLAARIVGDVLAPVLPAWLFVYVPDRYRSV
jgi:hypothetical protein